MKLVAVLRSMLFALTAVSYFVLAALCPRIWLPRLVSLHAGFCLWFMGVRVKVKGETYARENFLVIANHLSYIDVLAMASMTPSHFVTSVEMRDTPFLGHIARLAGCLFVERRSRENLSKEVKELTEALKSGETVVVFPEATSTDGSEVLRFRKPLFQAAIDAGVRILPMCLNYRSISGKRVDINNRDKIFWYGDMDFVPHIWGVFQEKTIELEIEILEPIGVNGQMATTDLAAIGHVKVKEAFCPV